VAQSVMVVDPHQKLTARTRIAWRILTGDRSRDPVYVELRGVQRELGTIDSMLRQLTSGSGTTADTVNAVKVLISKHKEISQTLERTIDDHEELKTNYANLKAELEAQQRESDQQAKQVEVLTSELHTARVNLQALHDRLIEYDGYFQQITEMANQVQELIPQPR
jgi:chromosome segregation ATPase